MVAQSVSGTGSAKDFGLLPELALKPTISVVIACFNEEENIPRLELDLLPLLNSLGQDYELILIDDGSTDNTSHKILELQSKCANIKYHRHNQNRGLGAALKSGFSIAQGDWINTLDCDLTFQPEIIKPMLTLAQKNNLDLVSGSPYLRPADMSQVPWLRRIPSLMMNALYRGLFGFELTAYTPLCRLYRASFIKRLELLSEGFEINAEIATLCMREKRPSAEIPVPLHVRTAGQSKLNRLRELKHHLRLISRQLTKI